jgi:SAM-dependent methyltransferase
MIVQEIIVLILKKLKRLIDFVLMKLDSELCTKKRQYTPRQYAADYISRHGVHPEAAAAIPYAKGLCLDIGCGGNKTISNAIGVDIVAKGQTGMWGNQKGIISDANVCASGDCLPFKDKKFDSIIARHNLEHYQDIIKTLTEWRRVLKVGGSICIVTPDDRELDTIHLDPTHKHVFTLESFSRLIKIFSGFKIIKNDVCIPSWSFICVLKKVSADKH